MGRIVKVAKESPLAEIVLRRYEKPFQFDRRTLMRKLCLSLGLLQPGDSRDVIVDLFQIILDAKEPLNMHELVTEVKKQRKNLKKDLTGCAESNLHRQVRRLLKTGFVKKIGTAYTRNDEAPLEIIFEERFIKFVLPSILERVKEYLREVDNLKVVDTS